MKASPSKTRLMSRSKRRQLRALNQAKLEATTAQFNQAVREGWMREFEDWVGLEVPPEDIHDYLERVYTDEPD